VIEQHHRETRFWEEIDQVPLAKDAGTGGEVLAVDDPLG